MGIDYEEIDKKMKEYAVACKQTQIYCSFIIGCQIHSKKNRLTTEENIKILKYIDSKKSYLENLSESELMEESKDFTEKELGYV